MGGKVGSEKPIGDPLYMGLRKQLTSTAELKFPTTNFHTNILTHYGPDEYISLLVELWMLTSSDVSGAPESSERIM